MVNITAETTLTYDDHVGRIIKVNDADGAITLPTILTTRLALGTRSTWAPTAPTVTSRPTALTSLLVRCLSWKRLDRLRPTLPQHQRCHLDERHHHWWRQVCVEITAIEDNVYLVQGMLLGSGGVTPFADS